VSCLHSQAYDGHMNLILSDVEETIMLVDGPDGAPPGQGVVNVSPTSPHSYSELRSDRASR
jgi:small nuclear ribonucleoprotein (snRNP)-like protein